MTNRNKLSPQVVWSSVSLSILALCLLALRHWTEHRNDAEVDRIAAETHRIESSINDVRAKIDGQPEAARDFVKNDAGPTLESLTQRLSRAKQRLSRAKWKEESPFSGESLALYGALACVLAASCINLSFLLRRRASTPDEAGEQSGEPEPPSGAV